MLRNIFNGQLLGNVSQQRAMLLDDATSIEMLLKHKFRVVGEIVA